MVKKQQKLYETKTETRKSAPQVIKIILALQSPHIWNHLILSV